MNEDPKESKIPEYIAAGAACTGCLVSSAIWLGLVLLVVMALIKFVFG